MQSKSISKEKMLFLSWIPFLLMPPRPLAALQLRFTDVLSNAADKSLSQKKSKWTSKRGLNCKRFLVLFKPSTFSKITFESTTLVCSVSHSQLGDHLSHSTLWCSNLYKIRRKKHEPLPSLSLDDSDCSSVSPKKGFESCYFLTSSQFVLRF